MSIRFQGVLFQQNGKYANLVDRHFDVPFEENAVLELFAYEREEVAKDDQRLWSAALYEEGAKRGNAGLNVNTCAVLDRDCADPGEMDATIEHLQAIGLAAIIYTSWSHGKVAKVHDDSGKQGPFDCYRVILPYTRHVTPAEHAVLVQGLFGYEVPLDPPEYLGEVAGKLVTLPSGRERAARPRGWDPSSAQPARGYYVPAPHSILELLPGRPLDVAAVLRRPTTAHPTMRAFRPLVAPSAEAVGALSAFDRALHAHGFGLSGEGFSGWRRSMCPSCQDPSPSLTVRANGDRLDMRCHALCKRHEILAAVGLTTEGLYAAPSDLRTALDEQLARQVPAEAAASLDEATERLAEDIQAGLDARRPTVIKYPAGTGKTHAAMAVVTNEVRRGEQVVYCTQEHAVAHEAREKLPADIKARSVHIHSPLIQVGKGPVCRRAAELSTAVFEFGTSLLGQVCPKCPFRDTCEAKAEAKLRAELLPTAAVIFVSHVGIRQVMGPETGWGKKLIVDEMPGAYVALRLEYEELKALENAALPSTTSTAGRVVREIARAWLAGEEPGDIHLHYDDTDVPALDLAREMRGRVALKDGARPTPAERETLKAADALVRMALWRADGGKVANVERPKDGIWAMMPDACHEALIQHDGVLLSATPLMPALPDFAVRELEVKDGAKVKRVQILRGHRGSKALTCAFYDDDVGLRRVRDARPDDGLGIPWPDVDAALVRACREAAKYPVKRVLFCTFKAIADELRRQNPFGRVRHLMPGVEVEVKVGHYGALRGKNDWQEGADGESSVLYCFGTPRFNMKPTLVQLGLYGEAADQAWVDYAAGELAQAEGRLRLPRRRKPCTIMVEGDVAPSTWYPEIVDEVLEPVDEEAPSAMLEAALIYQQAAEVLPAVELGRPVPRVTEALKRAAAPSIREAMGLRARATAGRKAQWERDFSWAPLTDP